MFSRIAILGITSFCGLTPVVAKDTPPGTPATPPAAARPSLPAGMSQVMVARSKKLREFLTAAGFEVELLESLGVRDMLNPLKGAPGAVASLVSGSMGNEQGSANLKLYSFEQPLTMDELFTAEGNRPIPGSEELRTETKGSGKFRRSTTARKIGPQEYFTATEYGSLPVAGGAARLSALRAAVARSGCLVWLGKQAEDFTGILPTTGGHKLAFKDLAFSIEAPGDLIIRASGTLAAKGDPPAVAAAIQKSVTALPFLQSMPENLRPRCAATAQDDSIVATLTFPQAVLKESVTALATGVREAEYASRRLNAASEFVSAWDSACRAGAEGLSGIQTVPDAMNRLIEGVPVSKSLDPLRVRLFTADPAYRQSIEALLTMKDGRLVLSSAGMEAEAERERKVAAQPDDAPLIVAGSRRNAQNLCSVFAAAQAAGADELRKVASVDEAVAMLIRGVNGSGQFSNSEFRLPRFSKSEIRRAKLYLQFEPGDLPVIRYLSQN